MFAGRAPSADTKPSNSSSKLGVKVAIGVDVGVEVEAGVKLLVASNGGGVEAGIGSI